MKIKSLIIGLGKIGLKYDINKRSEIKTHFKVLSTSKYFNIVGLVDKDKSTIKSIPKDFRKLFFKDYIEAIKKTRPKLIVIAIPTNIHYQVLKDIERFKFVKFIVCEKPLGTSYIDFQKQNFSKEFKKKIVINYIRNFLPLTNKLLGFIKKNLSKNVTKIEVKYSKSLLNNGSHFISLMLKTFGYLSLSKTFFRSDKSNFILRKNNIYFYFTCTESKNNSFSLFLKKNIKIDFTNNGYYIQIRNSKNNFKFLNPEMQFYQYFFYEELYNKILTNKNFSNLILAINVLKIINKIKNEI